MKRERLFTRIEAVLTGWVLAFSATACLVTAFRMETVSLWLLALYCALGALSTALLCTRRLGGLLLAGLLALGAGYLWQKGILEETAESLLYRISRVYHDAYDWPIVRWSWRAAPDMELTLAPGIYIIGTLLAVLAAWTVCRGQSSIVACLPATLPVAACFVVTDSLPDTLWLLLFLTAVTVLMLTSATRQNDRARGRRLAAMAVLPVFLAVGILFLSVPRQTYYHKAKAQAISDFLVGKYTLEQMLDSLAGNAVRLEQKSVDLASLGARSENQTKVLEVTTRYNSGTLYLRTTSLDRYTGKAWVDSENPLPELYWPAPADGSAYRIDEVVIKTRYAHEMLYLPYYPQGIDISKMTRGLRNEKKLNEYSITRVFLDPQTLPVEGAGSVSTTQTVLMGAATRLTEDTKKWAIPLAKQIVGNVTEPYYQALMVAEYVKNSARYDKNTGRMSGEYKDFAQWFLEESDRGYCVHFATAGAVLLKALGIPARYVTGYMVQTQAGIPTEVTVANAHAWVEYWLPGFGWTMLECTPPDDSPDSVPDQTQPQQTQPEVTDPSSTLPDPDTQREPSPKGNRDLGKLLYLLLIPAFLLGMWLQRKLRLGYRKRRLETGGTNQQALARWVEGERLSRILGTRSPDALRELAEKAKFSPYTLTEEELGEFDNYLRACTARLEKKSFFLRLYYRWCLALY